MQTVLTKWTFVPFFFYFILFIFLENLNWGKETTRETDGQQQIVMTIQF